MLAGCRDSVQTHWSEGPYAVWDSPSDPSCGDLVYKLGGGAAITRINCVSRIGSSQRYLIAESGGNTVAYWILDKEKDRRHFRPFQAVEGPLAPAEFRARKLELGIGHLMFEEKLR